jgi:alpha-N-arabinofuranosidase
MSTTARRGRAPEWGRRALLAGLLLSAPAAGDAGEGPLRGTIKLDLDRTVGPIDPKIYGNFIEHLGRCIYGGVWEFGSPLANADGIRMDVLELVRPLKVGILRWPGGNFVSGYHWKDGIGPVAERPRRIDLAWGAVESNRVGTDEYLRYCRLLGAEPYITVNMGTGTWDEARDWVEYCNRDSGTTLSELRRRNGSERPYGVRYWALGNEMDGEWQMGHRSAEAYGAFALEAAKMMKWIDPTIKLVACGSSDFSRGWTEWNRTVLRYLKNHADYIALHTYVGNGNNDYYAFLASTIDVEERIRIVEGIIRETMATARRSTPIRIAFDEYNVWYRAWTEQRLEETYTLEDALVIAGFLNVFVRNAHIVTMANMAQLVNVIAPVRAEKDTCWRQTIYYPLQLFATYCRGTSLQAFVASPVYAAGGRQNVPYLDVSASFDSAASEMIVCVVNRSKEEPIEVRIVNQSGIFRGTGKRYEVNGPEIKAVNDRSAQPVATLERTIPLRETGEALLSFPPHSFTLLRLPCGPGQ